MTVLTMGKILKRRRMENTFPHTSATRPRWPPSSSWRRPAIRPSRAGSRRRRTISYVIRYASPSSPEKLRRRRQTVSGTSWLCAGQRAAMPLSSPPIRTRNTFTVTFITIQRPSTAPGNSVISGARPLPCAGSPTGCVWKTDCPLWRIRSPGAKGFIRTTANGSRTGRGRLTFRINCGWQSTRYWQSAPAIWRPSSPSWNRTAMKSRRSEAVACLSG